jgi:mono/diheme cytochrome c family protein
MLSHARRCVILGLLLLGLGSWAGRGGAAEPDKEAAERGYRHLLTMPLAAPTLTEKEYFDLWKYWPEPLRSQAEKATPEERRKLALSRYGFQETPDRAGPIPQQFTPDGKGNLSINCLACHGGPVEGKLFKGLGNSLIHMATFGEDLARLRAAAGQKPPPIPRGLPPEPSDKVRGVNNAWAGATLYLSARDRDLNRVDKLQYPKPTPEQLDIPVRTPAWWLSKKKTRYYYDGFIGKSHRDIMQFSFEYSIPREKILEWEKPFTDIYAFINSLDPPKYPRPIDEKRAKQGLVVFTNNCASCHGTYGKGGTYPEKMVPLNELGTDPVRQRDFSVDFKKHLGASWTGDYGKIPLHPNEPGYIAPPLDGVWATAPYLHNGSVPTLWHLLTPDERPKIWKRTEHCYDHDKVGLEVTAYDKVPDDARTPHDRRLYYDTSLRGLGNKGHRFPANDLSDKEKTALLEYLKTL